MGSKEDMLIRTRQQSTYATSMTVSGLLSRHVWSGCMLDIKDVDTEAGAWLEVSDVK